MTLALIASSGVGQAADGQLAGALAAAKPILDMRLRYEHVDQVPFERNADSATLRTRLGFETGRAWDTSLLAEVNWTAPLGTTYNSTTNGQSQYPVVADPKAFALNRLHLTNTSIPATVITLGRQRIALDDQRFVSDAGWRQNEQTFDALRLVNTSLSGLRLDVTYLNRTNRVFGNYSAQGKFTGDTFLANGAYRSRFGKLAAFAYLVDFDEPFGLRDSSQTYGALFAGAQGVGAGKVAYAASYARQSDYAGNPLAYRADYYFGELSGSYGAYNLTAGYEVLGGSGAKGFTMPLAALHKFNGWADTFVTTPVNGLRDLYFSGVYKRPDVGPFAFVAATLTYHTFDSERLALDYGDEIDAQLQMRWKAAVFTVKYADYTARAFGSDTQKFWLQIDFAL